MEQGGLRLVEKYDTIGTDTLGGEERVHGWIVGLVCRIEAKLVVAWNENLSALGLRETHYQTSAFSNSSGVSWCPVVGHVPCGFAWCPFSALSIDLQSFGNYRFLILKPTIRFSFNLRGTSTRSRTLWNI
jgi:hypothetical protein